MNKYIFIIFIIVFLTACSNKNILLQRGKFEVSYEDNDNTLLREASFYIVNQNIKKIVPEVSENKNGINYYISDTLKKTDTLLIKIKENDIYKVYDFEDIKMEKYERGNYIPVYYISDVKVRHINSEGENVDEQKNDMNVIFLKR